LVKHDAAAAFYIPCALGPISPTSVKLTDG